MEGFDEYNNSNDRFARKSSITEDNDEGFYYDAPEEHPNIHFNPSRISFPTVAPPSNSNNLFNMNTTSTNSNFKRIINDDLPNQKQSSSVSSKQSYTQLKNFVGLSSPPNKNHSPENDEHISQRSSVISSLSSFSQEVSQDRDRTSTRSNETPVSVLEDEQRAGDENRNKKRDSNESNENVSSEIFDETNPRPVSLARSVLEDIDLFDRLFSRFDENGNDNPFLQSKTKIKVVTSKKNQSDSLFQDKLYLAQTIQFHEGPIWTMKFSPDGLFLCSAGQDQRVVVWCVSNFPVRDNRKKENNNNHYEEDDYSDGLSSVDSKESKEGVMPKKGPPLKAEHEVQLHHFIHPTPYRVFAEHTGDVIDIAWSKSSFILSASTDKDVRLWHVSRAECLQFFRHQDFVTSVEFNPLHDRYFVSGCYDRRLRVWDIIPEPMVREWAQIQQTITSVCFSPDGQTVAGGLMNGQVYLYEYEGMKYLTEITCRNRSGKYKNGTKVTNICYNPNMNKRYSSNIDHLKESGGLVLNTHNSTSSHPGGGENTNTIDGNGTASHRRKATSAAALGSQLLVTTNDNRIRQINMEDRSQVRKYKGFGLRNKSMQIKATFSDDGNYIICGSENGQVVIWSTDPTPTRSYFSFGRTNSHNNDKNKSYETFDNTNNPDVATIAAIFAPIKSIKRFVEMKATSYKSLTPSNNGDIDNNLLGNENYDPKKHLSIQSNSKRSVTTLSSPDLYQDSDLSTRVIVTCDQDGIIKVYFRLT
eukprot:gene9525-12831_t